MRSSNYFVFVLIYVFTVISLASCEDENYFEDPLNPEEIIDPHSFFYDKQNKKMLKESQGKVMKDVAVENNNIASDDAKPPKAAENFSSHEVIFYKRLINLLLSNINIKEKDEMSVMGIIEIEVTHSQMEILQNFDVQKISLRKIDEILSNIIRKPQYNYMSEAVHILEWLQEPLETVLRTVQQHADCAVIVFVMLMICLMLRMVTRGQKLPIFAIIQIIFVLSFFMTWWQLIQEAEVESTAAQMKFSSVPISCQPDKMNMWDKFVSFFSNDDCEQYYKTVMSNPKLKITPAFALSHFITTVVLHPITHVGSVISDFINNATGNLSWTYAWIVKCMLFLCVGIVIIMLPFCLSGASFNLGLGPLLRFGISYHKSSEKGNSIQSIENREPVQIILQVPQGMEMPQIKNSSENEQSAALQVTKSNHKKIAAIEHDSQVRYEKLSCGDTIENTELRENDEENVMKYTKLDAMDTEKKDGSGDC